MKKFFTLVAGALLMIGAVQAQQMKGDFDNWEACYPDGKHLVGQQPVGWTASNVYQVIIGKEFVYPDAGRTGTGAKIMNDFVGFGTLGANAPAFVTLGKMWVFADMMGMMMGGDDLSDGGVNGGVDFAYRPDSLVVYYKRKLGTEKPEEPGKVLAYLWKGTFKSKVVSAHNMTEDGTGFLDPEYTEIEDQDRAILGRPEVIPADVPGDGILIGKAEYTITAAADDWTRLAIPIEYVAGENGKLTPEKMNIVFSACNYWVRADIGKENTLWVDDASFVYNAKLASLKLDGKDVIGFNEDTLSYLLPYNYSTKAIEAKAYGKDAGVSENTVKNEADEVVKTITVTCNNTADVKKTYVYTLTFKGESVGEIMVPANAEQKYGDEFELAFSSTNQTVPMTYVISNEKVLKYDSKTGKFIATQAGSATVTARQDKEGLISAVSAPVTVNVAKVPLSMTLKAWCQRGTYFSFTTNSETDLAKNGITYGIDFDYVGLKSNDGEGTLKEVLDKIFDGKGLYVSKGSSAGKGEKIGEYRPIVLSIPGSSDTLRTYSSTNYDVTFEHGKGAEIRKTFVTVYPSYEVNGIKYYMNKDSLQMGIAAGSKLKWELNYSGFVYNEKDSIMNLLGTDTAAVVCSKDPATAGLGEVIDVTVDLPKKQLDTYEFKDYKELSLLIKKAYTLSNMEIPAKNYGDEPFDVPFVVTKEDGGKVDFKIYTYSNVSVKNDTAVTLKKAGDAYLIIKVAEDDEYAEMRQRVDFTVAKAPLTAKITPAVAVCNMGEKLPAYTISFPNIADELKYQDTEASIVTTPLTAYVDTVATAAEGRHTVSIAGQVSANYELKADSAALLVFDPAKTNLLVEDETSPVLAARIEDPDHVLAPGIAPVLSYVESGPYWELKYAVKKGSEKNKNLKFSFDARDAGANVMDAGGMWVILKGDEQIIIMTKETSVLVYDTPITEETSTLTAIHVADPEGVLSEDKAPVYTYKYEGQENTVTYTYYIKQGIDKEALKTLVPTFDCTEDYAWLKEMGGDFTKSGSIFYFFNADLTKSGTSLVVNYEEYTTREPITEIKETLNYAFDNNSDWVNTDGKYDNPTDWASSNPSGTYLGGKYPVTKAADGDNGYVKLSTLSPGYSKPNPLIPNIVSGSMFYGAFKLNISNPLKSTKFGLPLVGGYVTSVKGQFKYKSGETYYNNYTPAESNKKDNWSVVVVIFEVASADETLDGTNIATVTDKTIAMGALTGTEAADWTDFNCPVYLLNKDKKMEEGKLYKAAVVFSSSIDGANYNGSIGSELCLDNLEVTYSTEAPGTDPTSINNNTIANISIYPNPATTVINVAGAEAGSMYVIRNVAGGMVRSGELNEIQINVSDLAAGVYFLEAGGKTVKFIKK